jgi:hypothetical protein
MENILGSSLRIDWCLQRFKMVIDDSVALYNSANQRCLRRNADGNADSAFQVSLDQMPKSWYWEWISLVDAGVDSAGRKQYALYFRAFSKFLKAAALTGNAVTSSNVFQDPGVPADLTTGRFILVDAGKGEFAFYNTALRRFLRLKSDGTCDLGDVVASPDLLPSNWTWERFKIVCDSAYAALYYPTN